MPHRKRTVRFDQPLYDDDDADQQCSAVACVRLYTALGADLTALYRFNLIDLGVRILSTLGLVWRYQKAKKDGFLTKISD